MEVTSILKPGSIRCEKRVGSKKHALDILSEMLAEAADGPSSGEVLEGLVNRERLGSTGLGGAVAMPHARQPGISGNVGAVLKLTEPVQFDAPDGEPVDLLFGLLVPEAGDPEELDQILELVRGLRRPDVQQQLRDSREPRALYDVFTSKLGGPSGDATSGDATSGDATSGDAPNGDVSSGDASAGDASTGDASGSGTVGGGARG